MKDFLSIGLGLAAALSASAWAADKPSATEQAAIFKAAGFKAQGGKYIRCEDDVSASFMPGFIEMEDLNSDGSAEAWVRESSTFCYGNTAEAFVLLTKSDKGEWRVILDQVGMALVLKTKHKGWSDVEVGGPGMGPFPKFKYNGKTYVP